MKIITIFLLVASQLMAYASANANNTVFDQVIGVTTQEEVISYLDRNHISITDRLEKKDGTLLATNGKQYHINNLTQVSYTFDKKNILKTINAEVNNAFQYEELLDVLKSKYKKLKDTVTYIVNYGVEKRIYTTQFQGDGFVAEIVKNPTRLYYYRKLLSTRYV